MAVWSNEVLPVIIIELSDISEYLEGVRDNRLKIEKSDVNQSFAYFIKNKMEVAPYQECEIRVPGLDLGELRLKGSDLSNLHFVDTKFPSDLQDANFLGSKFKGVDLQNTNIQQSLFDDSILKGTTLTEDQRKDLNHQLNLFQTYLSESDIAIKEAIEQYLTNPGILKRLYRGFMSVLQGSVVTPSWAVTALRVKSIKKGGFLKSERQSLEDMARRAVRQCINDNISNIAENKIQEFISVFMKGVGDKYFIEEFYPAKDYEDLKEIISQLINESDKYIENRAKDWAATKSEQEHRWKTLERDFNRFEQSKRHAKKTGVVNEGPLQDLKNSAESIFGAGILKALSPFEESSYPAINPRNTADLASDIAYKQAGLALIGGGAGAVAAFSLSIAAGTGLGGGAIAAPLGGYVGRYAGRVITEENYETYNSQFGDRLLELGVMKEALGDSFEFVISSLVFAVVLPRFSEILGAAPKISMMVSTYIAFLNYKVIMQEISEQKKLPFDKRLRVGSPEFFQKVRPKMYDASRLARITSISSVALVLILIVSAAASGGLVPVFAFVAKLSVPALIGASIASGIGVGLFSYLSYVAAKSLYIRGKVVVFGEWDSNRRVQDIKKSLDEKEEKRHEAGVKINSKIKAFLDSKKLSSDKQKRLDEDEKSALSNLNSKQRGKVLRLGVSEIKSFLGFDKSIQWKFLGLESVYLSNALKLGKKSIDQILAMNEDEKKLFFSLDEKEQSEILEMDTSDREKVLSLNLKEISDFFSLDQDVQSGLLGEDIEDLSSRLKEEIKKKSDLTEQFYDALETMPEESVPRKSGDSFQEKIAPSRSSDFSKSSPAKTHQGRVAAQSSGPQNSQKSHGNR